MPTPNWQPGTIYAPGALVQPASAIAPVPDQVTNGGFESGNTDWSLASGFSIGEFGNGTHFQGTWSLQWDLTGNGRAINTNFTEVVPGQTINANCQVQQGASSSGQAGARAEIAWYDASDELISFSSGNLIQSGSNQNWKQSSITAVAPAGAAFARFSVFAFRTSGGDELWVDNCTWDAVVSTLPTGLVFRAVQAVAGYSGATEPVWPVVNGLTVVDNEVTWEAVFASRVVWEASPILVSGEYEPEWPVVPDGTVADGTVKWVAMNARVQDPKCPHSKIVSIAVSKIFSADDDIIPFSGTTNPLDWSSEADAGYLPFGLNTYGATPVAAMGLYRGNLVAFNSEGYQMWQVDQDPANMALLDASPVDCIYRKSIQAVMNDLAFLSSQGVRNIGIAGASTNLQAGSFGKQIDPLVLAKLQAGLEPISLFFPGFGQYWLIFDEEAFVLTINSTKDQSWSRYVFPEAITDFAIQNGILYLRAGDLVWEVSIEALADDVICSPEPPVLSGELDELTAELTWTASEPVHGAVDFYRLYDADTSTLIVELDALEYSQSGLEVDTTYRYYVTAVGINAAESEPSNTVELSTATPSAPVLTGFSEEDGGGTYTNTLEWSASTPAYAVTGYRLFNAATDVMIVQQAGLTYEDLLVPIATTRSYYVRAYGPGGNMGPPSNVVVLDTGDTATVIDIFTADGTWTKRSNLIDADVYVIAPGGGGGSGNLQFPDADGGGGGGGGEYRAGNFLVAALGATEAVTVGSGGGGGAAASGSQGTNGTDGGTSSFGVHLVANGGRGGRGGNRATGSNGQGGTGGSGGTSSENGGAGSAGTAPSSSPAPPPATPASTVMSGPGGGGASGRTSFGGAPGAPGGSVTDPGNTVAGGTAGTQSSGDPAGDGDDSLVSGAGGGGGGGGSPPPSSDPNPVGGAGGAGGSYGAGGGGGGPARGGGATASAPGGDGAGGIVVVVNNLSV
jgi:hypothetical protein